MSPCHTALVSIDDDGVLRTVALPDPTDVMTEQFRVGLDSIIAIHRDPLRELVESALMRVYQRDWSHQRRQKATSGRLHLPDSSRTRSWLRKTSPVLSTRWSRVGAWMRYRRLRTTSSGATR